MLTVTLPEFVSVAPYASRITNHAKEARKMWLIKMKDKEGRERKIVGNGYNAKVIGNVLVRLGFGVKVFRVETFRDAETSRLWCIDPENGRRLWVSSEEDLFMEGYAEVFYDGERGGEENRQDA